MTWLMWTLDAIALTCSLLGTMFMLMTRIDYKKETGKEDVHYTVGYVLLVVGVVIANCAIFLLFI